MKSTPLISIVVPVYKAEEYLHKCVDSLLSQTLSNFEILLVDDGSPDKSGELCDKYAQRDSRIRVFHKKNGGVSSARQWGMDNALGEYYIHADPDDWVEPNMLEELYKHARETLADMVICDYWIDYNSKIKRYKKEQPSNLDSRIVLKELFVSLSNSCCNKLVRLSTYRNLNVMFPLELTSGEDMYVNVALLKGNIKVAYLPKAFYHYMQNVNDNSIMRNYSINSFYRDLKMKESISLLMKGHELSDLCNDSMIANLVGNAFNGGKLSSVEFKQLMSGYRINILKNKNLDFNWRIRLYMSCIGLYRLVYVSSNIGRVLKRFFV